MVGKSKSKSTTDTKQVQVKAHRILHFTAASIY